jgi:hypothetical protein
MLVFTRVDRQTWPPVILAKYIHRFLSRCSDGSKFPCLAFLSSSRSKTSSTFFASSSYVPCRESGAMVTVPQNKLGSGIKLPRDEKIKKLRKFWYETIKGRFASQKFPDCTSNTMKARPFQRWQKYFFAARNDLAFIVSGVQFWNQLFKNRPQGFLTCGRKHDLSSYKSFNLQRY